jgi:hypothetical protein
VRSPGKRRSASNQQSQATRVIKKATCDRPSVPERP